MDIKEEDRIHLMGIAEAIREIQGYVGQDDWKEYGQETNMQSAISSQMQQVGSAAAQLSDEFKDSYRDLDWDVLKGLQYANFDQELELDVHPQWHIIKEDLPIFLEQIEDLMSEVERDAALEDDLIDYDAKEEDPKEKDPYVLSAENEEYFNRRSGDQLDENIEEFEASDEDDNILERLEVIGNNTVGISDEIREVPLGNLEVEDDSFIDKRYEDVDLMKDSSLDDHLEDSK